MVQWVKVLAVKPNDQSSIPGNYKVERKYISAVSCYIFNCSQKQINLIKIKAYMTFYKESTIYKL